MSRREKILASKAAKFQKQLPPIEEKQAKYRIQERTPKAPRGFGPPVKESWGSISAWIITDEFADDWQLKVMTYLADVRGFYHLAAGMVKKNGIEYRVVFHLYHRKKKLQVETATNGVSFSQKEASMICNIIAPKFLKKLDLLIVEDRLL